MLKAIPAAVSSTKKIIDRRQLLKAIQAGFQDPAFCYLNTIQNGDLGQKPHFSHQIAMTYICLPHLPWILNRLNFKITAIYAFKRNFQTRLRELFNRSSTIRTQIAVEYGGRLTAVFQPLCPGNLYDQVH
ncbi:MAG: hypothetical protein ACODTL_20690 [Brucella sp.]